MVFPRVVLAGHGVISRLGEVCREFAFHKEILIITGSRTRQICGDDAVEILKKSGMSPEVAVCNSATREEVDAVVEKARGINPSLIVGVGGGSKIDIAKVSASRLNIPFISVPTSAAHDGISSPRASIKEDGVPYSIEAVMPIAIIADTSILVKAPHRFLAAGCADVIANTTAVLDWELASRLHNEPFSTSAATIARFSAETLISHADAIKPGVEESVWFAIKQIIISGISMSIAGSSRPASGSEHMFAHMLERIAPNRSLHGEQCGVGAIMMMYLHGGDWKRIRDALLRIGAPTTAKELGVTKAQVIQALVHAHEIRPDRYTILGVKGLSEDAAERVVTVTGVCEK